MHYFWSANGPCVQLMSSLKAALRSSIRAVTDQDIVIVKGGPQNLRQLNCSFTTVSSHFFIKTKFRRSFWGAEQVCILIGSWIMTQNANISISGFYRFCKKTSWKCCNQIFSINHRWLVPFKFCKWAHFNKYWMTEWNFDFPLQKNMRFSPRKWQLWHFGSIFMDVSYTLHMAI